MRFQIKRIPHGHEQNQLAPVCQHGRLLCVSTPLSYLTKEATPGDRFQLVEARLAFRTRPQLRLHCQKGRIGFWGVDGWGEGGGRRGSAAAPTAELEKDLQFQFVSAPDGIVALGMAHTRSAPSLSTLPKVALGTEPIFVWLNADRSRPWRVECRLLPFSTPLSFRRFVL